VSFVASVGVLVFVVVLADLLRTPVMPPVQELRRFRATVARTPLLGRLVSSNAPDIRRA
jgi:hypothetical protein